MIGRLSLAFVAVAMALFFASGPALSLLHFRQLSKQKVIAEANNYIERHSESRRIACLYVVSCEGGRARLAIVPDVNGWDIGQTKARIWRRRFSDHCAGATANIGLQLAPEPGGSDVGDSMDQARWSFFNDRFVPLRSRASHGAFSEEPWERCTEARAVLR